MILLTFSMDMTHSQVFHFLILAMLRSIDKLLVR